MRFHIKDATLKGGSVSVFTENFPKAEFFQSILSLNLIGSILTKYITLQDNLNSVVLRDVVWHNLQDKYFHWEIAWAFLSFAIHT